MKERIYVCHTYYHVYVTLLKELALPKEKQGQATVLLSKMSTDFEQLKERLESLQFFEEVIEFDEKREFFFPELAEYRKPQGSFYKNMKARIRFTRRYAELEAPYIPVDFRQYKDIYVYCDSDPVGYFLNQNKIKYHAVEDGLNCLKQFDAARYDNRGHFKLKAFMSEKLNLIFVQNGYGKYCIDMEVNDISVIEKPCHKYKEVPRKPLFDRLTKEDKDILLHAFVRDMDALNETLKSGENHENKILVLTEPLCNLDVRKQIFKDIIATYGKNAQVIIKPHPRDELDYHKEFGEYIIIDRTVPMEMLNFIEGLQFQKVISVFTPTNEMKFGMEKIRLGNDFMDKYEDPSIHRQNEQG